MSRGRPAGRGHAWTSQATALLQRFVKEGATDREIVEHICNCTGVRYSPRSVLRRRQDLGLGNCYAARRGGRRGTMLSAASLAFDPSRGVPTMSIPGFFDGGSAGSGEAPSGRAWAKAELLARRVAELTAVPMRSENHPTWDPTWRAAMEEALCSVGSGDEERMDRALTALDRLAETL